MLYISNRSKSYSKRLQKPKYQQISSKKPIISINAWLNWFTKALSTPHKTIL